MTDTFTDAERLALTPYVSNLDSPIFALRNLPEEVVAVLFAYYSRSSHSLRRNLLRLLEEGDLDLSPAPVRIGSLTTLTGWRRPATKPARSTRNGWSATGMVR